MSGNTTSETVEDSGGSCNYYKVTVDHPWDEEKMPFEVECGEIAEALEMNSFETNMFKELWRMAAARQGKKKKGNSAIRGAEKLVFFAERILKKEERNGSSSI